MELEGFMHIGLRLISNLSLSNEHDIYSLVDIMSLRGTENWKIYTLTFLRKYSFFVKTFILWTSITIPWYTYSFLMLKLEKSKNGTEGGLDTFMFQSNNDLHPG